MSKEAMKLALKALEHLQPTALTSFYTIGDRNKAITALRSALAEQPAQQEPVAWLFTNVQSGDIEASTDPYDKQGEREYWHPAPLYTSPPAQPQQEPVAWYDSKTGWTDFHPFKPARKPSAPDAEWLPLYTSPPAQRKPLTDEEKLALLKKHFNAVCVPEWFDALLLDIEAAYNIKEKNT